MTDFERLQMVFNQMVEAMSDKKAYELCCEILDFKFLELLIGATKVTLEEFGNTYYPNKFAPKLQADIYIKNIGFSNLSSAVTDFKNNLLRDFETNYPKPEVMTTHISYDTVADFYCAYVCISIGFKMFEELRTLASTPLVKKSGMLFWKKVEIPLFSEFDICTTYQLKKNNFATPIMKAAWSIFRKEKFAAFALHSEISKLIINNQNTTIAEIKKQIINKANQRKSDQILYEYVVNLYDVIFAIC